MNLNNPEYLRSLLGAALDRIAEATDDDLLIYKGETLDFDNLRTALTMPAKPSIRFSTHNGEVLNYSIIELTYKGVTLLVSGFNVHHLGWPEALRIALKCSADLTPPDDFKIMLELHDLILR